MVHAAYEVIMATPAAKRKAMGDEDTGANKMQRI